EAFSKLKRLAESKGRILRSELKNVAAGQFNAILHFEMPEKYRDEARDQLKLLGNQARLQIDTVLPTEVTSSAKIGKIVRGDTQFVVSIYNLVNMTPRETNIQRLAVTDVRKAFDQLRESIRTEKGKEINALLNEQDRLDPTAQLDFDVRAASSAKIQAVLLAS